MLRKTKLLLFVLAAIVLSQVSGTFPIPRKVAAQTSDKCFEFLSTAAGAASATAGNTLVFKDKVYPDEPVRWYVEWRLSAAAKDVCKNAAENNNFYFRVLWDFENVGSNPTPRGFQMQYFDEGGQTGFRASGESNVVDVIGKGQQYAEWKKTIGQPNQAPFALPGSRFDVESKVIHSSGKEWALVTSSAVAVEFPKNPPVPPSHPISYRGIGQQYYEQVISNINSGSIAEKGDRGNNIKISDFIVSVGLDAQSYRVVADKKTSASINYKFAWKNSGVAPPKNGDIVDLDNTLTNPSFEGLNGYASAENPGALTCFQREKDIDEDGGDCTKDKVYKGGGIEDFANNVDMQVTIPFSAVEADYTAAKSKSGFTAQAGVPVVEKGFMLFAAVGYNAALLADSFYPLTNKYATFSVKVYETEEDLKKACEDYYASHPEVQESGKDAKTWCADPKNAQREGKPQESVTSGNDATKTTDALGPVLSLLSKLLSGLIWLVNGFLYGVFYAILAPFIEAMLSIHTYTNSFSAVIYPGWEVLRNLANIFFIIALLIIALTTIFRVQGYQWKHMLVELIIAAVLVNFSLIIAQGVLGIAETVQNQFLPNNAAVIRQLGVTLMWAPIAQDVTKGLALTGGSGLGDLITPLFYLALAVGSFLTFFAIAIMLVIRMVMLWILLMLSPVAYAARVLHATEHFAKEWWEKFLKYAFFVPLMALFLNIAALIVQKYPNVLETVVRNSEFNGDQLLPLFYKAGASVIILIFLLVALKVSSAFSIIGAKGLTSMAEKGIKFPFEKVKQGGEALKGWASDKTTDKVVMPVKQKFADMAVSDSKLARGVGKTALVKDYWATKKHTRDEEYKKREEQLGGKLHDASHVHDGVVPTTEREKLVEKYANENKKEFEGKTVKEIVDALEKSRASHKTDMEKQAQELATLVELAKRKETGALLEHEKITGTGDEAITKLLSHLGETQGLTQETIDRYAGRLNDIFLDTKQFQNVGVDIAHKLDYDPDVYKKFSTNPDYKDHLPELQQVYKDVISGKTPAPAVGSVKANFIKDMKTEIRTQQIKKMVKLAPGEFAKNVKGSTLEDAAKNPNFLALNFVAHMTESNEKQRDKDPTQLATLRKLRADPRIRAKLRTTTNVLTGKRLTTAEVNAQLTRLDAYLG